MIKFLLFIAFLFTYILYIGSSYLLMNKYLTKARKINFLENEFIILIPNIFFFAFIFIIGRFFNLSLLIISIIASNLGLILTTVIWSLLGDPKTPFKEMGGWAGSDFGEKNSWITIISQGLSALVLIAFPIIMGIFYFTLDSNEAIRLVAIKYSSLFILTLVILMYPLILGLLTSSFIDEDTRARIFLNQFASLITYSLFISLFFWVINIEKAADSFQLGNVNLYYSPQLIIILVSFILLFLVLPYFIGIQKAKRLRSDIIDSNTKILTQIINTFKLSTNENLISNMEQVDQEIVSQAQTLVQNESGVRKAIEYDLVDNEHEIDPIEKLRYQYYKASRTYDTRLNHYDFLNDTYEKIQTLKEQIGGVNLDDEQKEKLRKNYTEYFKTYKDEMIKRNEVKGKRNPILWMGILAILSPFVTQFMSAIGKYIIEIFKTM